VKPPEEFKLRLPVVYVPLPSNCRSAPLFTVICPPAELLTVPPSVSVVPPIATIWPVELLVSVPPWIVPFDRFRVDPADKVKGPPFTTALTVPVVPAPSTMVPLALLKGPPDRVSDPVPVA